MKTLKMKVGEEGNLVIFALKLIPLVTCSIAFLFFPCLPTFGQDVVIPVDSVQEPVTQVGAPPTQTNLNTATEADEDGLFSSYLKGRRFNSFMRNINPWSSGYDNKRSLYNRLIQSLSAVNPILNTQGATTIQETSALDSESFRNIFKEARETVDNFGFRTAALISDIASYEDRSLKMIDGGKDISPDDPEVKAMIEKAIEDASQRFGISKDKITLVRIEPGFIRPIFLTPLYDSLSTVEMVWNAEDRVYNTADKDAGLSVSYSCRDGVMTCTSTAQSGNDATSAITSEDPSQLVQRILNGELVTNVGGGLGGSDAAYGASTNTLQLDKTLSSQSTMSEVTLARDSAASFKTGMDTSGIYPIKSVIQDYRYYYDYKIILAYVSDKNDPRRTEMGFEYLITGNEVRISMATIGTYENGRLKEEICYRYDWHGDITEKRITTFKYDGERLKKVVSELFDSNGRKFAQITISFKYYENGVIKVKETQEDYLDGDGKVYYSTISIYEYNKNGQLTRHVEKYKNASEPGADYVVTMEETFEYKGGRLSAVTRTYYDYLGVRTYRCIETYEYYADGTIKCFTADTTYYYNGEVYYRYLNIYSYDRSGRQVSCAYKQFDKNGTLLYMSRYTWDYDGDNLMRYREECLIEGELVITLERTYRYENGKEVECVEKIRNNDGELAISYIWRRWYDAQSGNLAREEMEYYDWYATGRLMVKDIITYTYAGKFLTEMVHQQYQRDYGAGGELVLAYEWITRNSYDADGFNFKNTYITKTFENGALIWQEENTNEYVKDCTGLRKLKSTTLIRDAFSAGLLVERTETSYLYDEKGRNISFVRKVYKVIDGALRLVASNEVTYTYNERGVLVEKRVEEKIIGNDGAPLEWSIDTWRFDGHSRLTSFVREELDASGATIRKYGDEYAYDDETGLLILHLEKELIGGEYVVVHETSYEYDSKGRLTKFTEKVRDDETGALVNYCQELYTYDAQGRITSKTEMIPDEKGQFTTHRKFVWEYESDWLVRYAEMTPNEEGELVVTLEVTYAYDSQGRQVGYSSKQMDVDGDVIGWFTWRREFDANGRVVYYVEKELNQANQLVEIYEETYRYDDAGRLTSCVIKRWDPDSDHTLIYLYEAKNEYDNKGRIIFSSTKDLWRGTGYTTTQTYEYDDEDQLKSVVRVERRILNGVVVWERIYIYDYKNGRLVTYSYDFKEYNDNGQCVKWDTTIHEYDKDGKLLMLSYKGYDPQGQLLDWYTIDYEYDEKTGRLVCQTKRNYRAQELLSKEITTYGYDSQGRLQRNNIKIFDSSNNLVSEEIHEYLYESGTGRLVQEDIKRYDARGELVYSCMVNWEYEYLENGDFLNCQTCEEKVFIEGQITSWTITTEEWVNWRYAKYEKERRDRDGTTIEHIRNSYEYNDYGRLTLESREVLDLNTREFVEVYRDEYEYEGYRLTKRTIKQRIAGELVITYRDTYGFDDAGRLVFHVVENRIGGELVETYREIYEYDEAGRCVLHEIKKWIAGELIVTYRDIYDFDQFGRLQFHLVQARDDSTGELIDKSLDAYEYDDAGRMTYHILQERRGDLWVAALEEEITYNNKGIRIFYKRVVEERDITIYEYNNGGKLTKYEEQTIRDGVAMVTLRKTYEYDAQNRLIMEQIEKVGSDGELHRTLVKRYSYDGDYRLLSYTEENYDTSGKLTTVYILDYTYDSLGRVRRLELKEKIFVDGELRDKATIVFKYNKQGQLTLCNKKTYENGVLANETEIEYTYNSMGNVSQQKETATVYDRTNGACISKKETAYTFNGNGTLAKQHVQLYAWKGGNYILVDETLISYFYDRLGQRTMMKTVDKNFDNEGNYRGKMVETCHYDDMGRISGIVTLTYDSTDTLISKEEVTYEYDENGNRIIVTYHTQYDGNGNEQERSMTKEIVDQNGNVISQAKVVYDKDGNIKNAEANELQQRLDLLGAQNDERNVQEGIVVTHEMADPYKEENRELLPQ